MKRLYAAAIVAALSATSAMAQSHQETAAQGGAAGGAMTGAAAGAIGGAVIGGPVGAVVGGVGGAIVGGAAGGTIAAASTMPAEDRVYVRRYVDQRAVAPMTVRERVVVGRPLPRTVRTYRFENEPRFNDYRYARVNDQYILIDERGNVLGSID